MRTRFRVLANRFARKSSAVVALLALVGLLVGVLVLFWTDAASSLVDRASISSSVATLFALFAAIVAISAAAWVTTSDYKAEQAVKADTAKLRSALRSIMIKGVLIDQERHGEAPCLDFTVERETINKFLSSTTAYGYWKWVEARGSSAATTEGTSTAEPWRVFFYHVVRLLDACDPPQGSVASLIGRAIAVEELMETLDRADIEQITTYVADLAGALGTAESSNDVMLRSIRSVFGSTESERASIPAKLRFLKAKGIVDPNIDLFIGVFDNDQAAVKAALEAGADSSATDEQVLAAHRADLRDFDPTASPTTNAPVDAAPGTTSSAGAAPDEDASRIELRAKFLHLRKKGIKDANVDLFLGVFDNDVSAVKAALEAGADPSTTDKDVLAAHESDLADFDASS